MANRRRTDLPDIVKIAFLGLLIASSFLAGVLTANFQTRQIIDEVKQTSDQVKKDLELQIAEQDEEFDQHRKRDALHICISALDHLGQTLDLHRIAERAGINVKDLSEQLRPEVIAVCADTELKLNGE